MTVNTRLPPFPVRVEIKSFGEPKHHMLYRGWMDRDSNPAPYINDALFGKADGDSTEYEEQVALALNFK